MAVPRVAIWGCGTLMIGKAVLNAIAVLWLARLGRSLRREPQAAGA